MIILDGKKTSSDIKDEIIQEVLQLKKDGRKTPLELNYIQVEKE